MLHFPFKVKCVFMNDNAPARVSNVKREFFSDMMMELPTASPDLNPIEILEMSRRRNYMKVENNITAKQKQEKQFKVSCRKLNFSKNKFNKINRLLANIKNKGYHTKM